MEGGGWRKYHPIFFVRVTATKSFKLYEPISVPEKHLSVGKFLPYLRQDRTRTIKDRPIPTLCLPHTPCLLVSYPEICVVTIHCKSIRENWEKFFMIHWFLAKTTPISKPISHNIYRFPEQIGPRLRETIHCQCIKRSNFQNKSICNGTFILFLTNVWGNCLPCFCPPPPLLPPSLPASATVPSYCETSREYIVIIKVSNTFTRNWAEHWILDWIAHLNGCF